MDDIAEQLAIRDSFLRKMRAGMTADERAHRLFQLRAESWEFLQQNPSAFEFYKRHQFKKRAIDARPEDFK